MQPSNCLGILRFGKHYFCKDLEEKGRRYVREHFEQVVNESNEFLDLSVVDLTDIIKDDELNVKTEEVVFQAVQKWIDHDEPNRKIYLYDLLNCIRLATLPQTFIGAMMTWKPAFDNPVREGTQIPRLDIIVNSFKI